MQCGVRQRVGDWINRNRANGVNIQIIKRLDLMILETQNAVDEFCVAFLVESAEILVDIRVKRVDLVVDQIAAVFEERRIFDELLQLKGTRDDETHHMHRLRVTADSPSTYLSFPDSEEDSDEVELDLRLVVRVEDKQIRQKVQLQRDSGRNGSQNDNAGLFSVLPRSAVLNRGLKLLERVNAEDASVQTSMQQIPEHIKSAQSEIFLQVIIPYCPSWRFDYRQVLKWFS